MAIADKAFASGKFEAEYERELLAADGSDTGVRIFIKGMDCQASLDVHNKYEVKAYDLLLRHKEDELPEGVRGDLLVSETRDRRIACISRWDFNGEELFEGEGEPVCDYETKKRFLSIPVFHAQVLKWLDEIADFSKPSKEG